MQVKFNIDFKSTTMRRIGYGLIMLGLGVLGVIIFLLACAFDIAGVPIIIWLIILLLLGVLVFMVVWEGGNWLVEEVDRRRRKKKWR